MNTTEQYTAEQMLAMAGEYENVDLSVYYALVQAASDVRDAERYRFARDHGKAFENYYGCDYYDIDAAIDTAMGERDE